MRVLVNYEPAEKNHLQTLAYYLRQKGMTAVGSSASMTIGELLHKAKLGSCAAILLCNRDTLKHCVPGNKPTLDKWRGTRLDFSIPVIIINKLEHINTVPHGEWLLLRDLDKFKSIHIPSAKFDFTVLTTIQQFNQAYNILSQSIIIVSDLETATQKIIDPEDGTPVEAGKTWISCAGYTAIMNNLSMHTFVLPLVNFGQEHWLTRNEYVKAIQFMQEVNALPQPKCMHNGMYDATHALVYHAPYNNYILDTMAMQHAEFAELEKTLDFTASIELPDYKQWKDDSEDASAKKDIQKYWGYNAKDNWYTARVLLAKLRNMPAYARKNYALKFKLVYPALYCNFEGFLIDNNKRAVLRAERLTKLEGARDRLKVMFADPNFNPGSWQQVSKYIYDVFGAKKPNIGKSKSCTDEKNLSAVAEQHPLLALLTKDIIDYREAQKAIGTYFDFLQMNGRLLYALNPWGTETERMACNSSSFWCGTQIQNIPLYAKPILIADPGFELAEPDMNKAEARCTAYLSQELDLIKALENTEKDFYKQLGTLFFQMPYETVTDDFRNNVLKRVNHGANYMMQENTFIETVGVAILHEAAAILNIKLVPVPTKNKKDEMTIKGFAKMLLESYHKPFPRIRKWYKEVYNEVLTTGQLVSVFGHVRKFFGKIDKNHQILRSAVAHIPQNLSVTIINECMWRVYTEILLPSNGEFRLKAQIHDSMPFQYKKEKRDYYIPKVIECMKMDVKVHGRILRIPCDAKIGDVWGDLKKYKPPVVDNKSIT
jgi:DNA polymerase I-like protein with 3'-5' exonuclease and polymerase domains